MTWNLTLWNKQDRPLWMHAELWLGCVSAANQQFPNETCGLFIQSMRSQVVRLLQFPEFATPLRVEAHPQAVIDSAFALFPDSVNSSERVIGTFHTHPDGYVEPSAADAGLGLWADVHLILARSLSSDDSTAWPLFLEMWAETWWSSK